MIKALPINENNLLRWYNNTTPTLSTSQYVEGVHNGYLYKWRNHSDPLPILVNDTLTFYTNFDSPTLDPTKIVVLQDDVVIDDVTKYELTATDWGTNNVKIELTIPVTNTLNNKIIKLAQAETGAGTSEFVYNALKSGSNLVDGTIHKILKLANGNYLIVGNFTVPDQVHNNVLVVDENLTYVGGYFWGTAFNNAVHDVFEQADGKLIFVGDFTVYGFTSMNRIVRTEATGIQDMSFTIGAGASSILYDVEVDSTGNVYIGSTTSFLYDGSGSAQRIYKLSSVGARDVTYVPSSVTPRMLKIQPSTDKLLVSTGGGNGIRRLNSDGTTDGTFVSGLYSGASTNCLDIDGSNNIYVGGAGIYLSDPQKIAKLGVDGALDGGFVTTVVDEVYNLRIEGTDLYVAGVTTSKILNLSGTTTQEIVISVGTATDFLKLGTIDSYLIPAVGSVQIDGGAFTNVAVVDYVTTFETTITYITNCLIVKQYTEKNINNTHLLKFYHNNNIYDYEWGIYDVMVDTPYTVRVPSSIKDVSYPVEKTIYKSATSGRSRVTRAVNEKKYQFEIYYAEETAHDAIAIIASLKYFEINTKQYIVDGEYSVEFEQNLNIYKGILSLIDVAFGARINTCTTLS